MKGVYVLIIKLQRDSEISVGKLSNSSIKFRKGFYAYVGSALSLLEKRIQRHLSCKKKIYWHIDYLLNISDAIVIEVIYAKTSIKKECEVAGSLMKNFESIKNFGSSDCKCKSHLFYSQDSDNLKDLILISFKENGLKPGFYNSDN